MIGDNQVLVFNHKSNLWFIDIEKQTDVKKFSQFSSLLYMKTINHGSPDLPPIKKFEAVSKEGILLCQTRATCLLMVKFNVLPVAVAVRV